MKLDYNSQFSQIKQSRQNKIKTLGCQVMPALWRLRQEAQELPTWTGKVAHQERQLSHKSGDPSLIPRTHVKKEGDN